jgi:hypothetical protein
MTQDELAKSVDRFEKRNGPSYRRPLTVRQPEKGNEQ